MGRKADDSTAIPLCSHCHHSWHSSCEPFKAWGKEKRREFAILAIGLTRAMLAKREP